MASAGEIVRQRRGESLVDRDVGVPLFARVRRLAKRVVVERPERVVGEALVVELDLLGADRDRWRSTPSTLKGSASSSGSPVQPTQVPPVSRSMGSSARTRPPGLGAQSRVGPHHGEPVRGNDDRSVDRGGVHHGSASGGRVPGRGRRRDRWRPRCRPTGGRGCRAPPAVNRRPTRGSSRPGARSGSRPRRATRRA